MKFSHNELKFAVRWASLGRNVPVGLAAVGIDPLKSVVSALERLGKHHPWGNMSDSFRLFVIEAGPVLSDSLITGAAVLPLNTCLDNPVLLAGYLCHSPVLPSVKLGWRSRGSDCVLVLGGIGTDFYVG